jgi:hypothetical protein
MLFCKYKAHTPILKTTLSDLNIYRILPLKIENTVSLALSLLQILMKPLYLLPLLFLSCKNAPDPAPETPNPAPQPKPAAVGLWDFNGDGKDDNDLTINFTEDGSSIEDNPMQGSWTVIFNNRTLPDLNLTGGEPTPVGEGDLNGDGLAELTVVQAPSHGCTYDLTVWSYTGSKWKVVFGPELIPTACEPIPHDSLKNLIVKENGKVYFYKADLNDENFKKVKTEVKLQ